MKRTLLKLIALIMALSLSLASLVACGGDGGGEQEEVKHTHSFTG